ncbi:MAG: flagellar filament capping protein FliD [Deltaproteobacteria bacterium]|nr:flagellar filament capping protein FliD [Deltaproteobacteria bacterium]
MPVNFSGISSGLDTQAIIQATLAAQRLPVQRLQARKGDWNAQISSFGKIASKLDELTKLAKEMQSVGKALAMSGTVSDDKLLAATVDGAATAGRYELEVTRLARAEKDRSIGFASPLSSVKAGLLRIGTPGEDPVDITIDNGDSLQDVVDKINTSGARVDASIIKSGSQSFLQIVAADSGHAIGGAAEDAITIEEAYVGAEGGELGLTQVVAAQNAAFTVDGLPVEHRQNRITDVLEGVTLDLKKEGQSSLDVASNAEGTKEKIKAFVTLVNDVLGLVKSETRTSEGARKTNADPAIERLASEIKALVSNAVDGLSGAYTSASTLGIKTTASGSYELDTKVFDAVLAKDPHAIGRLFSQVDTGLGKRIEDALDRWTDPIDGIISSRKKALGQRVTDADKQIVRLESRLATMQSTLQRQYTRMEQALATIQSQGAALVGIYQE